MFSARPTPPSAVLSEDPDAAKKNYISALMIEAPPALSDYIIELERNLASATAELEVTKNELEKRCQQLKDIESKLSSLFNIP